MNACNNDNYNKISGNLAESTFFQKDIETI